MARFLDYINKFLLNIKAVTVIEYGVGALLITVAIVVAGSEIGETNVRTYEKISQAFDGKTN